MKLNKLNPHAMGRGVGNQCLLGLLEQLVNWSLMFKERAFEQNRVWSEGM